MVGLEVLQIVWKSLYQTRNRGETYWHHLQRMLVFFSGNDIYRSVSYQAATWLLSCGGDGIPPAAAAGESGSKLRLSPPPPPVTLAGEAGLVVGASPPAFRSRFWRPSTGGTPPYPEKETVSVIITVTGAVFLVFKRCC